MVTLWKIKVLKLGEYTLDKSIITLGKDIGTVIKIPVFSIAVYGNEKKILIDTGISDPEWVNENIITFDQKKEERMIEVLKEGLNWKPEEVDVIINTHLHYDHCSNNVLFSNAMFVIQRKEWDYAFNPLPAHKIIYKQDYFNKNAVNYFDWKFVNGEEEILPGIKVFPTPGHTKGHQSVLINTEEGVLCVAGDVCDLVENLTEMIPLALSTSVEEIMESLNEIKIKAKYLMPGHDPCIKNFQSNNFPKII